MHLAYSVAEGEDSPGIAAKFGVAENTLLSVNKITDPKSLQQGQILDVPLPGKCLLHAKILNYTYHITRVLGFEIHPSQ